MVCVRTEYVLALCSIPFNYPHAFLKKSEGDIVIASVRSSVRLSVMLSPPKPLDDIQLNLVCELLI